jgi:hypothetical protein
MSAVLALEGSTRRRIGRVWRWLIGLAATGLLAVALPAIAVEALEASVKAAYIYKFLPYVEWPAASFANADSPQVIGVMSADAVHGELEQLVAGRRVNGRALVVRKVTPGDSLEGVHVLYLGRSARASAVMPMVVGKPVLVITDAPTGLAEGGALNFILVDGRVRFEAAPAAAERSGLRLSSRLLAVAERVVTP